MRQLISGILLSVVLFMASGQPSTVARGIQTPFSSYRGSISWEKERFFLDNFAYYLIEHPSMVGHIAFYTGPSSSRKSFARRVDKAVKYLTKKHKISTSRLIVHYAGSSKRDFVILQPSEPTEKETMSSNPG
jgi:hypothetical protein